MKKGISIAIDGPVAAGKGTIAPLLAKRLEGFYLYTGAMYRCVALFCIDNRIDLNNEALVDSILPNLKIEFKDKKIFLNGKEVTEDLKREEISMGSSKIALYEQVRKKMVDMQKQIVNGMLKKGLSVVAEGRDTATRVIPDADIKIFLTAKPEIRAKRRFNQLLKMGSTETLDEVLDDVNKRDKQDMERKIDPLVLDPYDMGYEVLDNSLLTKEETLNWIVEKIKNYDKH